MYSVLAIVLLAASCLGAPQEGPSSRVIGGTAAADGEIPVIVSLRSTANRHFCGGSVLNENYILTAAHCITGSSPSSILVVTGTNTLNAGGTTTAVSKVIVHEKYSASKSWQNDIGLLKLAKPLVLSSRVQAIQLPEPDRDQGAGLSVLASGWGYTSYPGLSLPNNLQKVTLNVVSNSYCQSKHSGEIYETSVCASDVKGRGVCNGDSGSPLLESGSNVIVGIVSWGRPCAQGVPDVYTRVSQYRDWIQANAV